MSSPCTVSGNLQQLTSGQIGQGKVIFQLANIGTGLIPGITGTSIFPNLTTVVESDLTGAFSIPLWGNDNINPANTIYSVTFKDNTTNQVGPILYSITGGSLNLNSATPLSSTPPIVYTAAILSVAAPTVGAGQVGLGSTTATSATTGANGDVPAQVVGYLIINVAGTAMKVPYYNT